MNTELKITGLKELMEALKQLPPELVREAQGIVQARAEAAMRDIAGAYPSRSGDLRNGLRLSTGGAGVRATARVVNTSQHAYVYERGTRGKKRQWANGKNTGAMPAGKVLIPIAVLHRRVMVAALVDLVTRAGLTVTTTA